jgi:potassium-transporting ATPase KdpC subunit
MTGTGRTILRAIVATLLLAVITGLLYPLVMTAVAQVAFGYKANGSLAVERGRVVGSTLIGQAWTGPEWFYGRPSATSTPAGPYDASASSGSNQGPLSQALAEAIEERAKAILDLEGPWHQGLTTAGIPPDLLTASGSGLDPHVSPEAATFQAPRIAAKRELPLSEVTRLIDDHTSGPTFGFLGKPRVNVLELNLALATAARERR